MFDKFRLKAALVEYKKRFVQTQWPDEKYKWEAVKCFRLIGMLTLMILLEC